MTNAFNLSQLANNTNSTGQVALGTGVSGTLPVANGGTGAATLTTGNVVLGAGTAAVTFVAPGVTGNVLTSNGTTWTSAAGGGGGALPGMKRQIYTVAGASTFTVPTGVTQLKVTVIGGGSGSSMLGFPADATGNAGGLAIKWITGLVPGAVIATTVGAGGAIAAGGTSSFAAYCSATGGVAPANSTQGVGSGGDINGYGNAGLGAVPCGASYPWGGSTMFTSSRIANSASTLGAGGASWFTGSAWIRQAGGPGMILVEWIG